MIDIRSISNGLLLGNDGIWHSQNSSGVSYPLDGNEMCFAIEDGSFWFRHRNNCIIAAVRTYPPRNKGTIFDIGGGNGFVAAGLAIAGFDVALVEPGRIGAMNARRRGLRTVICATADTTTFNRGSLPAIGLFDVIEHIEDDYSFLRSMRELIEEEGYLYATAPSYPFLWSGEDVSAGHFRRYSLKGMSDILTASGFEVIFSSYIFRFLPVPIFLFRALPYKIGISKKDLSLTNISRDHAVNGGLCAHFLYSLLQSEISNIQDRRAMRFGSSCLIVAKRP